MEGVYWNLQRANWAAKACRNELKDDVSAIVGKREGSDEESGEETEEEEEEEEKIAKGELAEFVIEDSPQWQSIRVWVQKEELDL